MPEETKTLVTERPQMTTEKQLNSVTIVALAPWKIAGIRALRVYLQTLVGLLLATGTGAAAAVGVTMSAGDFGHDLLVCASISIAPAAISLLQNIIELLAKLDATNPGLRA